MNPRELRVNKLLAAETPDDVEPRIHEPPSEEYLIEVFRELEKLGTLDGDPCDDNEFQADWRRALEEAAGEEEEDGL